MQKYVSLLSQLENRQNLQTSTAFEVSTDNNEISFDQLLQKSEDNMSSCVDHVFKQIEINTVGQNLRQKQEIEKEKARKLSFKQKNEEIGRERQQFNRKLDEKLSKSKQKYKKETANLHLQRQQVSAIQKENQDLRNTILQLQSSIQQLNQKLQHEHQQANKKISNITKQAKCLKSQLDRLQKQKQNNATKAKNLIKQQQKCDERVEELQKKLRVKQKQMKKMEELQEERSNYYQSLFETKQVEIERIKSELIIKSQEIHTLNENNSQYQNKSLQLVKELEGLWEVNKDLETKIQENAQVIQKMNNIFHEGVSLIEEHLKQPIEKTNSNFSSRRGYSSHYKTSGRKGGDQAYFKYFLSLIVQIIERNKIIMDRKETQIKNFQGIYEVQLEDLDKKMSYLIEENKHLKVKNQEINKTYTTAIRNQPAYHPLNSQDLRKYMSSVKINQPKIKEDVLSNKTVQVLEQIEKARKVYKQTSAHIQSASIFKQRERQRQRERQKQRQRERERERQKERERQQGHVLNLHHHKRELGDRDRNRCMSETNLFKRSRRSLSWKKPAEILKQYI